MKKIFEVGILFSVLLLILSCVSIATTPFLYTNNTNTNFEILGEIIYESSNRIGYTELLRAARKLYPDCDFVIDLMIDQKETTTRFFFYKSLKNITWLMRGTAIKYVQ